MQVTNLQDSPMDFFGESREGRPGPKCTIPAGATVDVPDEIWDRYAERADIKAMNGTKIAIGGATAEEIAALPTETQQSLVRAARENLAAEVAEFEVQMRAAREELDKRGRELDAMRAQLDAEREALREERAKLAASVEGEERSGKGKKEKGKG